MKKLRSLVAALVALLMVFSLAPAALADGEKATEPQYVSTEEYDEETNTSIYQDITKSYGSIIVTNEDEDAGGHVVLEVETYEGCSATVNVAGDIVSTNPYGYADGIYAEAP